MNRGNGMNNKGFNSPDYANIDGLELNVTDQNAYGFMCNTKEHKILYAPKGCDHQVYFLAYTKHFFPNIKGNELIMKAKEIHDNFDLQGRVWLNVGKYDGVISTWNEKIDKEIFNKICEKFKLDKAKVIYTYNNSVISLDSLNLFKKINNVNFKNAEGFRKTRDNKNAEYNKQHGYSCDAERHFHERLDEGNYMYPNVPDFSEIGTFEYETYIDEDDYAEYLNDNCLQDSDDVRKQYFNDEVFIDLTFYDHEYDHYISTESMQIDDIRDIYGDKLADIIFNNCYNKFEYKGQIEKISLVDEIDLTDDAAVNDFCEKYMPTTEYFKGCRGFILSNGTIVTTEQEHNDILIIPGLESKFQFIEMGNIRIMPNSIDIGQCPTMSQIRVLRQIINEYSDDELYLDLIGGTKGQCGCRYDYPDDDEVISDIYRYYQEGIKPTGGHGGYRNDLYENIEDDEYTIGSEGEVGDRNMNYSHIVDENIENEFTAYHGSRHDFDKFNHKKYLSTGAGSQSFGWGTYVTDDEVIAKSYTQVGNIHDNVSVEVNGTLIESHLPNDDDIEFLLKCIMPKLKSEYSVVYNYMEYQLNRDEIEELMCMLFEEMFDKNSYSKITKQIDLTNKETCVRKIQTPNWWEEYNPQVIVMEICRYILMYENDVKITSTKTNKICYVVDIPDDNGVNYLKWYEPITDEQLQMLLNGVTNIYQTHKKYRLNGIIMSLKSDSAWKTWQFGRLYNSLESHLKSAKSVSLLLIQCGFVGIKYPSGTRMQKPDGAKEDGTNYVIFDANNVTIKEKNFLQEGFASKKYEKEILSITNKLHKNAHKSNDNKCHKQFLINDVLMQFNITINNVKQIGGGFYDTAYGLPTININIHEDTSVNELFELLMHEITHVLDREIRNNKKYKNYNHKYSIIPETLNDDIREILYILWDTSERNAWQTSVYDKDIDINYFYDNVTEYLNKFEQEIDEETLERLRDYFARTINLKWANATLIKVKKYFITTTKKQLKKFVSKFKNMQKQLNENSEMEMKAYHGSGTKFKKFDSSFNGSGEGSHSFGPGHYFTSSKNIGKDYANEHGTSQEEIGKFSYNGETSPYIVIRRIKNLLYNLSNQDDVEKLQEIAKNMYFSSDNSDQLIRKICMFAVRMWKQRDPDYEQDYDNYYKDSLEHYRQKLKKEIKDVNNRTLYQVELPEADKFANWEMTVPNKWLDLLYSCLESNPKLLPKLKDNIESYINKDGKLTIGTLYYSLDNMHYDATLGHHLFKTLLKRYGYVGLKYPSGLNFQTSSTKKGDMNYTVFDDNNIKITNRWDL